MHNAESLKRAAERYLEKRGVTSVLDRATVNLVILCMAGFSAEIVREQIVALQEEAPYHPADPSGW